MFAALLSLFSALSLTAPAAAPLQPDSAAAARSTDFSEVLIGLTHEWVETWNDRNLTGMQRLHAPGMLYGFGGTFVTGEALIEDLRRENFWGLSWALRATDLHVRILGAEAALVSFRLVGQEMSADRVRPYAALFTLVFQRQNGAWKIVHVHDSDQPPAVSGPSQAER